MSEFSRGIEPTGTNMRRSQGEITADIMSLIRQIEGKGISTTSYYTTLDEAGFRGLKPGYDVPGLVDFLRQKGEKDMADQLAKLLEETEAARPQEQLPHVVSSESVPASAPARMPDAVSRESIQRGYRDWPAVEKVLQDAEKRGVPISLYFTSLDKAGYHGGEPGYDMTSIIERLKADGHEDLVDRLRELQISRK